MSWNPRNIEERLLIGSTLVEGSTLTETEAREVLAGRTLQGHPVTEIRELLNYRAAVEWLIRELAATPYLSKDLITGFHLHMFQGFPGQHGRWKTSANYTYRRQGIRHDYSAPASVEEEMRTWVADFNRDPSAQPLAEAASLYYRFQQTHPFEDGNGRIGRVFLSYWLDWKAGLSFTFRLKDKTAHLEALESANDGDFLLLEKFLAERTQKR